MANEVHKTLSTIADALQKWNKEVVYIGGFVIELYREKEINIPPRVTNDVDCIIQVVNRGKYFAFQEDLRSLGFREDTSSGAPICRWKYDDITVDIMPTDAGILGFSNPWYQLGIENKSLFTLNNGVVIYILPVEIYVATKLVALKHREGGVDFRYNKDLEDIIYLICVRENFAADVNTGNIDLRAFFKDEFTWILEQPLYIREAVQELLPPVFPRTYVETVLNMFKTILNNCQSNGK